MVDGALNTFVFKGHRSMLACLEKKNIFFPTTTYLKLSVNSSERRGIVISESVLIWICSKLENILFHNWNTPYRTVSISTTCWRKFVHFRFAEFCSVLKSIRGDGSLGLGNLLMTSEFWLT